MEQVEVEMLCSWVEVELITRQNFAPLGHGVCFWVGHYFFCHAEDCAFWDLDVGQEMLDGRSSSICSLYVCFVQVDGSGSVGTDEAECALLEKVFKVDDGFICN